MNEWEYEVQNTNVVLTNINTILYKTFQLNN